MKPDLKLHHNIHITYHKVRLQKSFNFHSPCLIATYGDQSTKWISYFYFATAVLYQGLSTLVLYGMITAPLKDKERAGFICAYLGTLCDFRNNVSFVKKYPKIILLILLLLLHILLLLCSVHTSKETPDSNNVDPFDS